MENKQHWEEVGADYDSSWTTPAKELLSRKELDFVSRHLPREPAAVLDVGIGSGRILERLVESTGLAQVYGVDVAESMVEACRRRFCGEPRVAALAVCDISVDPIPFDIAFDFISSIRVLKYSRNWPDIVAKLVSHLSITATGDEPGEAALVFSMPNRHSISRFSRAYAVPWETTTHDELVNLVADLGATVAEIVGFGRLPFFLYQIGSPRALSKSVMYAEGLLSVLLGPTFLTRELFVAVKPDGGRAVLRAGPDRIVTRRGAVVEKAFLGGDTGARLREAEQEFGRLQRLHTALEAVHGAACARPIEVVPGPPPTIRMEAIAGRPLLDVLRFGSLVPERLSQAAATAAQALAAYVAASDEPYLDFQLDNLLYDQGSATVGFVDLGVPDQGVARGAGSTPLEVSLGQLIGSTIFQSARPKWLSRRRQRRQSAQFCAAIVHHAAQASSSPVSAEHLRLAAHDTYRRCAFGGPWPKWLWYATGGYVLATRMRVLGAEIGPSGPRTRQEGATRSPRSVPGGTNRK